MSVCCVCIVSLCVEREVGVSNRWGVLCVVVCLCVCGCVEGAD